MESWQCSKHLTFHHSTYECPTHNPWMEHPCIEWKYSKSWGNKEVDTCQYHQLVEDHKWLWGSDGILHHSLSSLRARLKSSSFGKSLPTCLWSITGTINHQWVQLEDLLLTWHFWIDRNACPLEFLLILLSSNTSCKHQRTHRNRRRSLYLRLAIATLIFRLAGLDWLCRWNLWHPS